jgi:hypothetical protein
MSKKDIKTKIDILYDMWLMECRPEYIHCANDIISLRETGRFDEEFLDYIKEVITEL